MTIFINCVVNLKKEKIFVFPTCVILADSWLVDKWHFNTFQVKRERHLYICILPKVYFLNVSRNISTVPTIVFFKENKTSHSHAVFYIKSSEKKRKIKLQQ